MLWLAKISTSKVRDTGALSTKWEMSSLILGNCSWVQRSASCRVLQKLRARTWSGSAFDRRRTTSTKPGWFLRIGRILSWIVLESSPTLPGLVVTATTRENIAFLLSSSSEVAASDTPYARQAQGVNY